MNLFTKLSHKPKFFTSGRLLDKTDLVLYRKNIIRKSKELFVTVGFITLIIFQTELFMPIICFALSFV